jgi:hypothetical protein
MDYVARVASIIVVGFLAATPPCARCGGSGGGGGHGGSGGHGSGGHGSGGRGGHAAGKSSVGNSSGHSFVHSMGHPFGKIFGHRGKESTSPQLPTSSPERGKLLSLQNTNLTFPPAPRLPHPKPFPRFTSQPPIGFLPHHRRFRFGGCPVFPVPGNSFLFGNSFNCFNDGFFFDPFFCGTFSGSSFYGPGFGGPLWSGGITSPSAMTQSAGEPGSPDSFTSAQPGNDFSNSGETPAPPANRPDDQHAVTLLQLRDGSMYGLTDYWLEGDDLHYKTTYGGQNSVPFEQIDFAKTIKLNADRGVQFILRSNHASP